MKSADLVRFRFPVLFGGFLMMAYMGFSYRQSLIGDIESKRISIFKVDEESNQLLEAAKRELQSRAR